MDLLAGLGLVVAVVIVRELARYGTLRATKQYLLATIVGLAMTYLGVGALAFGARACAGTHIGNRVEVESAIEDPDYHAAGKLLPGDVIVAVDGQPLDPMGFELSGRVHASGGKNVTITVERGGARTDVSVKPGRREGEMEWRLGVKRRTVPIHDRDTGAALEAAAKFPIDGTLALIDEIKGSVAGRDTAEPGGPVRIVQEFAYDPPFSERVWRHALRFAVIVMMLLVIGDVVRFALVARAASR